jgi:dihydroxyacetone kinase
LDTIQALGKAQVGDKTMVDVLVPFVEALALATQDYGGRDPWAPWREAAAVAHRAARDTAELTPRLGRARPLAERSLGHPDAGAVSMALIIDSVHQPE